MSENTLNPEGRCPKCYHIRGLYNGRMVLHYYPANVVCEGSFLSPIRTPPRTITNFQN